MKISFFFAWFDLWIGFYFDQKERILYVCPLPCCVVKIESDQHNMQSDVLPQCEKCGSSFLWSNDGSAVCCNPECGNRR